LPLGDMAFDIVPRWENNGNSETVGMTMHLNRLITKGGLPDEFSFGDVNPRIEVAAFLGVKAISDTSFTPIARSCIEQFNKHQDGVTNFYLWGWAKYWDIFADTIRDGPHLTRFCWSINQVMMESGGSIRRISYGLCKQGNCADQDCPKPQKAFDIYIPSFECLAEPSPVAPPVPSATPQPISPAAPPTILPPHR